MENQTIKLSNNTSIGALLLDAGKISITDAERIIAMQKQKGLLFGDAAKALGLVTDDDIQQALSRQFDFPYLSASDNKFSSELVAAYSPFSSQVEALRAVRSQLILRWLDSKKTLAIVSPERRNGRSFLAANLAIVFSQLGERTLLIDADLRQPRQHKLFKLDSGYGLSDVLADRAEVDVLKKIPSFRDLSVLQAGTVPPNPIELLSRGLKKLLQQLQSEYDVILVDTPAAKQGADVQIIAGNCCGGAIMAVKLHENRLNELQLLKDTLQEAGCQCLGTVAAAF